MKRSILNFFIWLCNAALKNNDGAENQEEINNIIKCKNEFIKERNKCK